ncbi:MAG: flagellar export chaperone FliS [Armatimonadota bacterium]|nr:flagellar export chaperone FliS [Armatimonadota bacterium]
MAAAQHPALLTYKTTEAETASPLRLVVMLYDGALRFLEEARVSFERNEVDSGKERIRRVERILLALMDALDHRHQQELANSLMQIYQYIFSLLERATARSDVRPLEDAVRVLRPLGDAWRTAEAQLVKQAGSGNGHGPIP